METVKRVDEVKSLEKINLRNARGVPSTRETWRVFYIYITWEFQTQTQTNDQAVADVQGKR